MSASARVLNGIGQPVRRKEDFRLLTGRGRYGDDLVLPGLAHAVFARSPHAHARIAAVGTAAALANPGVLAVLTGADYRADGLGPIPHNAGLMAPPDLAVRLRGGAPIATPHWPLPTTRRASSASRSRWWSPKRSPRPRMPSNGSTSPMRRCRRSRAPRTP